ncbi:membrane protein [Siminovitchia terrae]|uniref:DUF4870 domain-containing protein n=1 Tax=Siminovitchia terrae TaxID=1914933 RepID=A0A429X9P7_SIMTE|nr:DUF4870 domain-containing protein [Siminovitchia terrae]RST60041.1 DUF4870 domain-containing protein [Siminovitchia terrae]GIN92600.1 membrane protein [Siminovitchia terrae]GIN97364.1 membrane protein [Siminovitchia terrae]
MDDKHDIESSGNEVKSSTGLDENIAGLLCYLGTFVTGIIFFVIEKKSTFVKFHATQSVVLFLSLSIIGMGVGYVPFVGWLLKALISLTTFVLWIVLLIKAYQKERIKVPIVGDIAESLMGNFDDKS